MPYTNRKGLKFGLLLAGWMMSLATLLVLIASPVSAVVGQDWEKAETVWVPKNSRLL
jgi:hypothetical protein